LEKIVSISVYINNDTVLITDIIFNW